MEATELCESKLVNLLATHANVVCNDASWARVFAPSGGAHRGHTGHTAARKVTPRTTVDRGMGNRSAEDSSDKLQRKLAKVDRKRKQLRWLCTVQVLLAVAYGVYVLTPPSKPEDASTGRDRSVIVYYQVHAHSHPSTASTRRPTNSHRPPRHAGDARLALGARRPTGPLRCDRAKDSVGERERASWPN